jgi:hypothetical protein
MFAYCGNNTVNNADPSGYASWGTNTVAIRDGYGGGQASIGGTSQSGSIIVIPPIPGSLRPIGDWLKSKTDELWDAISKSFARAIPRNYVSPQEEHHIVAKKAFNAKKSAEILWIVFPNDGVENPLNKVYIKTGLHRRIHRKLYYAITNQVIIDAYNAADGNKEEQIGNVTCALNILRGIILVLNAKSPY